MKNFGLFLISILIGLTSFAQIPHVFKYQAVIRDANGDILTNQLVSFEISILKSDVTGSIVYTETHTSETNKFGLVTLEIGNGKTSDDFTAIDWGSDIYFIKIAVDPTGGTSYEHMGTTQLLSVPYALHAKTVENIDDADADPENEIQDLVIDDHSLSITKGSTVTLPDNVDDADADPQNEIQDISIDGHMLSISGGSTLQIPDSANDADADPQNEIQVLSLEDDILKLTSNGAPYEINLSSYMDNTDNQVLSIDNHDLTIERGNTITLPDEVNDADANPGNEIQSLCLSNDTLSISKSNFVTLPYWGTLWAKNGSKIYYNNGNVGIGTSEPGYLLDIQGDADLTSITPRQFVYLHNRNNSMHSNVGVHFRSGTGPNEAAGSVGVAAFSYKALPSLEGFTYLYSNYSGVALRAIRSDGIIKFITGGSDIVNERMRIDYKGNVGIGTSVPKSKLEIADGDIYISNINKGIIMKSPDGQCWRITVENDGSLSSSMIPCP
ncbi:MAG: hypothetical protein JSV22_07570 [Bacteroidales bacterium]|nr:MAG: hypothetical protein JSV22_07570 [Bacteroidales bacterium]